MSNIPDALVETWLFLASNKSKENTQARKMAIENLTNVFGNIEVAKAYLNNREKPADKLIG